MNIILEKLNEIEKDTFITKILDDFLRIVRLNAIQNKIRPYTTVSLAFLAGELKISEQEVKTLLVELILEEKISGKIDQQEGYFERVSTEKDQLNE